MAGEPRSRQASRGEIWMIHCLEGGGGTGGGEKTSNTNSLANRVYANTPDGERAEGERESKSNASDQLTHF